MALKPDRELMHYDIDWYMNTTAEAGGVVSVVTAGSGGYPGNSKNVAAYAANPSGAKPIGFLIQDVIDYDTNRMHENWEKAGFEVRKGQKVVLIKDGRLTTNMVPTGVSPSGGDTAYLAASGMISPVQASGAKVVGTFRGSFDQDRYVGVDIKIQA